MKLLIAGLVLAFVVTVQSATARAECDCVAVAAEVALSVQAMVAGGDNLYARGDYDGALEIYARAYTSSKDSVLIYAQAMCRWQLGAQKEAEALFALYLEGSGTLAYRDRAEGALDDVRAGVAAGAGAAIGGVVGGAGGLVGGVAGAGGEVVGTVRGKAKPKKVAKGAAILLGVVAVVAVAAVAIHGISAGLEDDLDASGNPVSGGTFDKKFGIGMGLTGVVVGATAFYLYGLTAAAGVAGKCVGVAPYVSKGGGGLAAALKF